MSSIDKSDAWNALQEHTKSISNVHLKELMQDTERTDQLTFSHDGVFIDFSRQNATQETGKVRKRWMYFNA